MGKVMYMRKGDTHTAPVIPADETLENNSWAIIRAVSDAGLAANYWAVGDTKAITINGTVGKTTFSNLSIDAFIIGFDHNSEVEGANTIHFKIGKISNKQVAIVDESYGSYKSGVTGYFNMNTSNINSGGWASSHMRKTILGSNGTPTSPAANTLLAALPAELRAVMKTVTKYTNNKGGNGDTASKVTSSTECLFLPAEFEMYGARTYANSAEQNYQEQYAYYAAGNTKVHYQHSSTGTAIRAHLRSPAYSDDTNFCRTETSGSVVNTGAYYIWGIAPCFVV